MEQYHLNDTYGERIAIRLVLPLLRAQNWEKYDDGIDMRDRARDCGASSYIELGAFNFSLRQLASL